MYIEGLAKWEVGIYAAGQQARVLGHPKESCPYWTDKMKCRCLWLGGWNDKDIEIQRNPSEG